MSDWKLTKSEHEALIAKLMRGSHGGKQMAKLSSKESKFVGVIFELFKDYLEPYIKDGGK